MCSVLTYLDIFNTIRRLSWLSALGCSARLHLSNRRLQSGTRSPAWYKPIDLKVWAGIHYDVQPVRYGRSGQANRRYSVMSSRKIITGHRLQTSNVHYLLFRYYLQFYRFQLLWFGSRNARNASSMYKKIGHSTHDGTEDENHSAPDC